MPIYEYKCNSCENSWEIEQKITDSPIKECPTCKKLEAKRLISGGTAFQLSNNGSVGWGSNGYSNNK
jgi:putative FmdB family regulatory protein